MSELSPVEQGLGLTFEDRELLDRALTHRSFASEQNCPDNERLELLGDAVVELVVVEGLFRANPEEQEGVLSQLKSRLVSRPALASLARRYGIGEFLRLGRGESASGGAEKEGVLADAMEAIVGAAYLDSGLWAAEKLLEPLFSGPIPAADHKGRLQEWLQARSMSLPSYRLRDSTGPDHEKTFTVECLLEDEVVGLGVGPTKKQAEQVAAEHASTKLEIDG